MQRLFLTFFGAGLSPKTPGTVGSIAGTIVAYGFLMLLPASTLFLVSICLFLYSIKIIDDYEAKTGVHDHGSIVIDEVAGVWLAISISGATAVQFALSVLFFRAFDIWKSAQSALPMPRLPKKPSVQPLTRSLNGARRLPPSVPNACAVSPICWSSTPPH